MSGTDWKRLFETTSPGAKNIAVRVFMRGGHPLLIVPRGLGVPRKYATSLYAPQTRLARIARRLWQWSFPIGFSPGCRTEIVSLDPHSAFVRFLSEASEEPMVKKGVAQRSQIPPFTMLIGNPDGPGPRFIIQVFDSSKRPVAVIKAGNTGRACELIDREAAFLRSIEIESTNQKRYLGVPKVSGTFRLEGIRAFAMPFIDGNSPRPEESSGIEPILNSWLKPERRVRVCEFAAWRALERVASQDPVFRRVNERLSKLEVAPALFHGDFAPWNIRVPNNGAWTVLDWERGETAGPPAWDWFHFVLQSRVLRDKAKGFSLTSSVWKLLKLPVLGKYLKTCGITGQELEWLLAYLMHCAHVLMPAEGRDEMLDLIRRLNKCLDDERI